ncbi:MAG: Lrp/AsnC family transcriptional regulator [Nitrososphaerota archaeon]|nr:Lrp/AsnC family transcriptional regulator [Candidatus Bathyarchaeota archaeon]MDW8048436.1 Lrp/AsnC family transcriptional regulator [Nitrososphaerota archaeon]
MPLELDEIDKKIIEMLQDDSRIAFRKIAEKVGVSEATVFVRVKKLHENGVIKRFTVSVSPELLGKGLTAFVLINADPKRLQHVLDTLSSLEDVYEVYDVTGAFYVIAKIRTSDREKLAKIIDTIGLIDGVRSTETAVVLRSIKEETRIRA